MRARTTVGNLIWDVVKRLRDRTKVKSVLRGILAAEDAKLAAEAGIDGIIVSNHGGRVEDDGRSTIDALPEITKAVGNRMPVLVDSGFRRGTDIVKALAMGAQAVCVGRPYLWGLGAFGQPGVERVLEILRAETLAMQQVGAPSINISYRPWCGAHDTRWRRPNRSTRHSDLAHARRRQASPVTLPRLRARPTARSNAADAGNPATQRQELQRFTASLRALPAENRGRRAALIFTGLPVRGLRPSRAARLTTRK